MTDPNKQALAALESGFQFADNRSLAVTSQWINGWEACLAYVRSVLPAALAAPSQPAAASGVLKPYYWAVEALEGPEVFARESDAWAACTGGQAPVPLYTQPPAPTSAVPAAGQVEAVRTDLVPGKVHCAKCSFSLLRTNLYVNSGTTGPGDSKTEPCPNGCGPLWPVTWEQEAREAWATLETMFDRMKVAEDALAAIRSAGPSLVAPPTPQPAPSVPAGVGEAVEPVDQFGRTAEMIRFQNDMDAGDEE